MNKSSASYSAYDQVASPDAGAKAVAGKDSADCDDTLRKGKLPKSSPVTNASVDKGACLKAGQVQTGQNGNPKKRDDNTFGIGAKAAANEKELK